MPLSSGCVLCGVASDERMRACELRTLQEFVRARCKPSAFHFEALAGMSEAGGAQCNLCQHCSNWRRRCKTRKGTTKVHTPFDSVLLYVLEPGRVQEPDRRCFKRLFETLGAGDNVFRSLIPSGIHSVIAKTIQTEGVDPSIDVMLSAWWGFNENGPFFRHTKTAQAIRMHRKRTAQQRAAGEDDAAWLENVLDDE